MEQQKKHEEGGPQGQEENNILDMQPKRTSELFSLMWEAYNNETPDIFNTLVDNAASEKRLIYVTNLSTKNKKNKFVNK